jgi:hypothetical protein
VQKVASNSFTLDSLEHFKLTLGEALAALAEIE